RDFHVTGVQTCALPIFGVLLVPVGDPGRERAHPHATEHDHEREPPDHASSIGTRGPALKLRGAVRRSAGVEEGGWVVEVVGAGCPRFGGWWSPVVEPGGLG